MSEKHEMDRANDPLQNEIEAAARLLSATWARLGSLHKMIGGGCSCGVGGIVLGLADFEQDIGDYLRNEGEQYQRRDVLALLDHDARIGDHWSIAKLLTGLADPTASVDPAAARFIIERLTRTLQSFEDLHRGR